MSSDPKSLKDWRKIIEKEVPYVDVKQFSHNIISLALSAISRNYGKAEANQAIEEYDLKSLGWSKVLSSEDVGK